MRKCPIERISRKAGEVGIPFLVISLLHLIALKCHSLQNSKALRRLKDMDDLIQLILVFGQPPGLERA
jgi:hypothetical protein